LAGHRRAIYRLQLHASDTSEAVGIAGGLMRRLLTWLTLPLSTAAHRAKMLAEADQRQNEERAAAMRRIIEAAYEWDGPIYPSGR
jgi:hypothetical protein